MTTTGVNKLTAENTWAPTGVPELPWYPDWTVRAACRGLYGKPEHPADERYDPFFDFGAQEEDTLAAKRVCYGCPVRLQCLTENLWVPFGIWGGYTERERRSLRQDRRDRAVQTRFFWQEPRKQPRKEAG